MGTRGKIAEVEDGYKGKDNRGRGWVQGER